jgi:hypothetical protein
MNRATLILVPLLATACSQLEQLAQATDSVSQMVTAAQGGMVCTPDQPQTHIYIPPGALARDTQITIDPTDAPAAAPGRKVVGKAYEFGPSGTHFAKPATVMLHYDPAQLGSSQVKILAISADGTQEILDQTWTYPEDNMVEGYTSHFTTFVPIAVPSVMVGVAGTGAPALPFYAVAGTNGYFDITVAAGGSFVIDGTQSTPSTPAHTPDALQIVVDTLGAAPAGSHVTVTGMVTDPGPCTGTTCVTFWDRILDFWNALGTTAVDANGMVVFTYPADASALGAEMCQAPPGYPSGSVELTFDIPGGEPIVATFAFGVPSFCQN